MARSWMARLGVLAALVLGVAVAAALWQATRRPATEAVAVLGDAAPDLHAAMGTEQALPVRTATFTLVSVAGWERLAYMSDMAAICGSDCAAPTALVRAVTMAPGGSRKVVLVNLEAWPGATDGEAPDFSCLAETMAAERTTLGPATPPACAAGLPMAPGTRWVLPLGLGAL